MIQLADYRWHSARGWRQRLVLLASSTIIAACGGADTPPPRSPTGTATAASSAAQVSSYPMGIAMADPEVGYVSLAAGSIHQFHIRGDAVEIGDELVSGLQYPRGIGLHQGTLFVAELGDLPCEDPVPACKGQHVDGDSQAQGEAEILAHSNGRITAINIRDGSRRTVADGLPVVNTDHGLNGVVVDQDGALYAAVGHLDQLFHHPTPVEHENMSLLGSIIRVETTTGEVEPVITGLRNVYGIAVDSAGHLWGVDNDGKASGGWRFEELLRMQHGDDYGFPDEGTLGPHTRRTDHPIWIMPGVGSAGIALSDDDVYVGSCGRVDRIKITNGVVEWRTDAEKLFDVPGCVTDIKVLPANRLLLAVAGAESVLQVRVLDD
jgi:hypothetical protein